MRVRIGPEEAVLEVRAVMNPHYFWDKPVEFLHLLWPQYPIYDKQQEICRSVVNNSETFCPAGNMLGKDFISGMLVLWFFLTRWPCRVVTSSADHSQLESVLWGEIRRFIQTSVIQLDIDKGGPLVINHMHLRKHLPHDKKQVCGLSYCIGRVAAKGEGLLGHHIANEGDGIPRTLLLLDEASGVEDMAYERGTTWANRIVAIGNCYTNPTGANFFEKGVKSGDIPMEDQR